MFPKPAAPQAVDETPHGHAAEHSAMHYWVMVWPLIILAIWRQQKGDEADELIESVTGSVSSAADAVTSFGRSDDQDETA